MTRVIRTATGDWEDSLNYTQPLGNGDRGELKHPGFPDPNAFYEMGLEWHATSLRYFFVFDQQEVTLWQYQDAAYIPTLQAPFLHNVWHSTDWWNGSGTADYPANDAIMRVDWLRYWQQ